MPLSDTAIRNAKPTTKAYRLFDSGGLYLEVAPSGGKWWRLKYRSGGKEKRISVGVYPETSLKDARDKRDHARKMLASAVDPGESRKAVRAARAGAALNSFEVVAREWFAKNSPRWNKSHGDRIQRRLERDVFPWIGGRPIGEVMAPEVLDVVRKIEERGALETAHRGLANCGQVFRYAVATARAIRDPTADLRGALPPVRATNFAAVTEPQKVGALLRAIDGYEGSLIVKSALRIAPLTFVRPGELRKALWTDVDLDAAEWRFHITKTRTDHVVPFAVQAVAVLQDLKKVTGDGKYVFPCARTLSRPMSDNAVLAALRRLGIPKGEMTGHGFRAMARTILDEVLGVRPDIIEHQLAHAVRDPLGRAYNRTAFLAERRVMMQRWADYLDEIRT